MPKRWAMAMSYGQWGWECRERERPTFQGRTQYRLRRAPFPIHQWLWSRDQQQDRTRRRPRVQSIRVRDPSSPTFLVGRSMGATHSARIDIKLFTELHGTVNLDQLWIGWVCDDPFYGQRPKWVFYAWPNRCAPLNFSQISPSLRSCAGSALGAGSLL